MLHSQNQFVTFKATVLLKNVKQSIQITQLGTTMSNRLKEPLLVPLDGNVTTEFNSGYDQLRYSNCLLLVNNNIPFLVHDTSISPTCFFILQIHHPVVSYRIYCPRQGTVNALSSSSLPNHLHDLDAAINHNSSPRQRFSSHRHRLLSSPVYITCQLGPLAHIKPAGGRYSLW